jgi:hypothetical protein
MYNEEESVNLIRLVRRLARLTGLSNLALARLLKVSHATTRRWLADSNADLRVYDSTANQVRTVIDKLDALDAKTGLFATVAKLPMGKRFAALEAAMNPTEEQPVPGTETNC